MASKLKKDDTVIVITGKDKNRVGKILRVYPEKNKVLVEGINIVTEFVKPNPQQNVEGGLIKREMPMQISNVAVLNLSTNKADRVGFKFLEDGRKVRYFKSNDEVIDV